MAESIIAEGAIPSASVHSDTPKQPRRRQRKAIAPPGNQTSTAKATADELARRATFELDKLLSDLLELREDAPLLFYTVRGVLARCAQVNQIIGDVLNSEPSDAMIADAEEVLRR